MAAFGTNLPEKLCYFFLAVWILAVEQVCVVFDSWAVRALLTYRWIISVDAMPSREDTMYELY